MANTSILLVEDDKELATFVRSFLLEKGYEVTVCESGVSALKKTEEKIFDVALLDWTLSDITGVEVCKHIKKHTPDTVVIMLTGKSQIEDKQAGFMSGADDYLTKPFEPEELFLRISARTKKNPHGGVMRFGKLTIDQ